MKVDYSIASRERNDKPGTGEELRRGSRRVPGAQGKEGKESFNRLPKLY